MNPEVKQKWIDALRSGEYEQGMKALRDRFNRFCCLGVLCDIYIKEHPETKWETSLYDKSLYGVNFECVIPPEIVWKHWAQLNESNPVVCQRNPRNINDVLDGQNIDTLASLNDTGFTFEEIAQIIEHQL
jgi:hypothetical protein